MPHLRGEHDSSEDRGYAAVFVDFENVFYYLQNEYAELPDLSEYTLELLRKLRDFLESEFSLLPIVRYAYADFERLAAAPLGSLYLMGIEIRNVLGAQHKNAADMRLCIDAMQVLYTRPEIRTFVFVAGDRDYIPVIQHIQTQARTVKAVAFRGNLSGDLLQNIGEENFIDALHLFDDDTLKRLEKDAAYAREAERLREEARRSMQRDHVQRTALQDMQRDSGIITDREGAGTETPDTDILSPEAATLRTDGDADSPADADRSAGADVSDPPLVELRSRAWDALDVYPSRGFARPVALMSEEQHSCLELMLREYGSHHEIWLKPFLRRLTDIMPQLADYERKSILHDLEQFGAIRIELRRGEPNDYRVVLVNYNHPDVRNLHPG